MDWARNLHPRIPCGGGCYHCHDAYEVHAATLWGIHTCVTAVHIDCKTGVRNSIRRSEEKSGVPPTHLHVGSSLPTGGAPQAILRSRQNKQAIAGLRRALRFVDGNFNTPCPALGFGANDAGAGACDELVAPVSIKLDVGVPISDGENDEESGVWVRGALGE
jgi:hypothetical protein